MLVKLGAKPLADFSQPLAMMKDCHRRIEHFLEVLQRLSERFGEERLTEEARGALARALDYFSHAAPRHTADEEESLFPRMTRSSDSAVRAVLDELNRLEAQHRRAEDCHQRVDHLGRRWLEAGRLDEASLQELRALLGNLTELYATHIRLEEERIFVLAERLLDANELAVVGSEMERRRT